jgi:rare lipoprotein A
MKSISFRTAHRRVSSAIPGVFRSITAGAAILGLALSASAKDSPTAQSNGSGQTSTAKRTAKRHWFQVGVASWYGREFQGRRTAAGERFDMNSMTCAHPSLPMGTWLKVTNLDSRETAFVRVNDRGPFFEGRIVDLSFAAAHAVGLEGIGKVKLEALADTDPILVKGLLAQVRMPVLFDMWLPRVGQFSSAFRLTA